MRTLSALFAYGTAVLMTVDVDTRRGHLSNGVKVANKCSTNTG